MLRIRTRTTIAAAVTALVVGLSGCNRDTTAGDVAAMNTSNIQRISNIYAAFQNYNNNRGPKDEAEFKTFIKQFDQSKLTMMGFDPNNVDAAFVSERDGKPFRVRYRVGGGRGSVDAVAFEQEGKDGKKQVGFTGGKVEEPDEATFQQLLAGKGPSQAPAAPPTTDPPKGGRQGGRPTGPPPGAPTGPPG
jgi:hypothetical protein